MPITLNQTRSPETTKHLPTPRTHTKQSSVASATFLDIATPPSTISPQQNKKEEKKMFTRFFTTTLLFILLVLFQTLTLTSSSPSSSSSYVLNISHFIYPRSNAVVLHPPPPHPSPFLKEVLEAIAAREKWKDLSGVRVSKLEAKKLRHGTARRYDFRVGFGRNEIVLKMFDQMSAWKRVEGLENGPGFEGLVRRIGPAAKLDDVIKLEGPFELSVRGDDQLSLHLPLNISHAGLERILVGEGITVEVTGAEEVTMFYTSDLRKEVNESISSGWEMSEFRSFWPQSCKALLPIHILGSASVVAYRTLSPDSRIETAFMSRNTIELLPGKCFFRRKKRGSPLDSLNSRIALLEEVFGSFLSDRNNHGAPFGFLKAKIKASSVFRFHLELERDVQSNDTQWSTLAEWRTKPTVERICFEVVARFDTEVLKPLVIKKIRPIIEVDSLSWSNLMSNISFTKFPSVLVAPESLTLDVKW